MTIYPVGIAVPHLEVDLIAVLVVGLVPHPQELVPHPASTPPRDTRPDLQAAGQMIV